MSTTSQVSSLATRIGQEIKSLWTAINNKAPSASPSFTGTVVLPSSTSIGNVSSTELGYVDGVTGAIQGQLNAKSDTSHDHAGAIAPTGSIIAYAGSTAPSGWLMCNNLAVSRSTYSALFALIGTTYGAGNGSTTFNLPDLRGRVIAGLDAMGGAASASRIGGMTDGLGRTGGAARVTLSLNEMPNHRHDSQDNSYLMVNQGSTYEMTGTSGAPRAHYTGWTGSSASHENMQHTMLLNYIIKI